MVHLVGLKFADHSTTTTFDLMAAVLAQPAVLVFYIVSMVVVAFMSIMALECFPVLWRQSSEIYAHR